MNADVLYIMMGYCVVFITIIIASNFMTRGFYLKYIGAKASRGKKQLVLLHSETDSYWVSGKFSDKVDDKGAFTYRNRAKIDKLLTEVTKDHFIDLMGVKVLEVNDVSDNILTKVYSPLTKFTLRSCSPEKADMFVKRAAQLPRVNDTFKKIVIALLAVILIVAIIGFIVVYNNQNAATQTLQAGFSSLQNITRTI
jgi:hypothetical protein